MKEPNPSEVAALVVGVFNDMNSEIEKIVASAVEALDDEASDAGPAAAPLLSAPAAKAPPSGTTDALSTAALPPVELRRRDEATIDAYDPPTANPKHLPAIDSLADPTAAGQTGGERTAAEATVAAVMAAMQEALAAGDQQQQRPAQNTVATAYTASTTAGQSSAASAAAEAAAAARGKFPAAAGGHHNLKATIRAPYATIMLPREAAAVDRHIKRNVAPPSVATAAAPPSPTRVPPFYHAVAAPRPGSSSPSPSPPRRRRAASAPRLRQAADAEPTYERLYKLGTARGVAGHISPGPPAWLTKKQQQARRMDEDEWGRVSARLYEEASRREARLKGKLEKERRQAQLRASSPPRATAVGSVSPGRRPQQLGEGSGRREAGSWDRQWQQRPRSAGADPWYHQSSGWAHGSFEQRQAAFMARRDDKLQRQLAVKQQAEDAEARNADACARALLMAVIGDAWMPACCWESSSNRC